MNVTKYTKILEALLFSSSEPLSYKKIAQVMEITPTDAKNLVTELKDFYSREESGVTIYNFKDKVQIGTNPEYVDYVKKLLNASKSRGLSESAMEVLSIIAYKQPITKSEIEYIRGINSDRLIYQLMDRLLVEEKGRLEKIGRPKTYGTTDIFLRNFNLKSLKDLPQILYDEIEV